MFANIDRSSISEPDLSYPRASFLLGLLIALTACAFERPEMVENQEGLLAHVRPAFPGSELKRGREGWVIVAYAVDGGGIVTDVHVKESSGSPAFEEAALKAVRQWRFVPGEERELTLLVTFLNDRRSIQLSSQFAELNKMVHEFIDLGKLGAAETLLAKIRSDDDLSASELAYTFLADERIAGIRGDRNTQLDSIRMAMLYEGRWLPPETYVACLHDAILLEIGQEDHASALRDYELLVESAAGKKLAADLEELIQALHERVARSDADAQPYFVADGSVSVKHTKSNWRNSGTGFGHTDVSAPTNKRGSPPPPRLPNNP